MLGRIEGGQRRGQQRMRWLDGITDSMGMSLVRSGSWCYTGKPGMLQSMGSQRVRRDWETELNWSWASWSLFTILLLFLVLNYHFIPHRASLCRQVGLTWKLLTCPGGSTSKSFSLAGGNQSSRAAITGLTMPSDFLQVQPPAALKDRKAMPRQSPDCLECLSV